MFYEQSVLVALGGNALILPEEKGYIEEQFIHTDACMKPIADLIAQGARVVITHGNGPIVGNILLRNECAKDYIPPMPLYICVADSQGGIGAMMAESLRNELAKTGLGRTVAVFLTHVLVDENDHAFAEPTKPIGPYYPDGSAQTYMNLGWKMRNIPERGWRRLVPSPRPMEIVESEAIRIAFRSGIIPIAAGGGGIPVTEKKGTLKGVDAVVDKDLSAGLLARELGLERFVILTDVDGVYLGWGRHDKKRIGLLTAKDARRYLLEGQFHPGSMGPKVEAAIRFIEAGGGDVVIARPEDMKDAMEGKAGTRIVH